MLRGRAGDTGDTRPKGSSARSTPRQSSWINLQSHYELDRAEEQIDAIVPLGAG